MQENAIEMIGITKTFPGVVANDNVNLSVRDNEVHALLGENGAGKSTLMSILFGSYDADSGIIKIRGKEVRIKNPNDATALGIGMVHQHFKLVHNYTVTENIVLGIESRTRLGMLDLKSAERRVAELSAKYGLMVNPRDRIEDISVGMQQRVEILKTLYRNADILILDEPSAVLTPQEIDELMDIIRRLKQEGKTIILITHKLREIKAVAERCTVLRRGKYIDTVDVASATEEQMAELMVGRAVKFEIDKAPAKPGDVRLSIRDLSVLNSRGTAGVKNLSLDVRSGEIVGIAGIDGNGQTELIYAITGLAPAQSGSILVNGADICKMTVKQRIEAGIGHIPEDRHKHGLILDFSIAENAVLKDYDKEPYSSRLGVLDFQKINDRARDLIDQYDIRAGEGPVMKARNMSGGNQQKVIIAREIGLSPDVLVVAQPTRGLDVGAIEYIRKRIVEERDKGRAVLLVSFELDEIMNLCDRIAIISKGEIVGTFDAGEVDEHQIGLMMAGMRLDAPKETER
ncbi:MAG TPA: ABC transporter ATP-binding protein [Treponemataceae bacterium]|nr:ABC transporter ATP-binding protein [Treponemataceae bacterium]